MKTEKEVRELIDEFEELDAFIKVYVQKHDAETFKNSFIAAYNKSVKLFKEHYLSLKEKENADWDFVGWPEEISEKSIAIDKDGLMIKLESYMLEVYGHDIPLPIVYDEIVDTINSIEGIKYEYEGIINYYYDPEMEPVYRSVIGNKGRKDYTFTWNLLKEKLA